MGVVELVLTVCCFKWQSPLQYRTKFRAKHVNTLRNMFRRHLRLAHEFVCITDDPSDIDQDIRIVPLWNDLADVPNPHGIREPSCYRRLKVFSGEMRAVLGERVVWCDLDMVLTGDVTPLFSRPEPVVLMPTEVPHIPVNGSLVMVTPGAHEKVWTKFDPNTSPRKTREANCFGSDQGWIAYCLKDKAAFWKTGPKGDGIYFYGQHLRPNGKSGKLPADARIISFHGRGYPWDQIHQELPWVREHYR